MGRLQDQPRRNQVGDESLKGPRRAITPCFHHIAGLALAYIQDPQFPGPGQILGGDGAQRGE